MALYKFEFKLCRLEGQNPTDQMDGVIEFYENHIKYLHRFYADELINEEDEKMGWQNNYNELEFCVKKERLSGVQKYFLSDSDKWKIVILLMGVGDDVKVYFTDENKAAELYALVYKYIFNT